MRFKAVRAPLGPKRTISTRLRAYSFLLKKESNTFRKSVHLYVIFDQAILIKSFFYKEDSFICIH